MSITVTKADAFKSFFPFIKDWDRKNNISYHILFVFFLHKIGKIHDPQLTTRSLLIKTIIIEYFTIIEAVVDAILCQLEVKVCETKFVPIDIDERTSAERLFELAKKYGVVDNDTHSKLGQLKKLRNRIHIKKPHKNQKSEYEAYTIDLLKQHQKLYSEVLCYLFEKNSVDKTRFPWPWDQKK